MNIIVAVDECWGIGKNNDLLFSIPDDMKFFRETTKGKVVVMGSNTLKSFPNGNPLKNRVNVVLSSSLNRDDCVVVRDFGQLKRAIEGYEEVFLIGGERVYADLIDYCDTALVTKVDADGEATAFFPNLDNRECWSMASESEEIISNDYKIKFTNMLGRSSCVILRNMI